MLPDRQSGVLASTLQSHIFSKYFKSAGQDLNLQCSPCGFRFYRPVRSRQDSFGILSHPFGVWCITLPAVINNLLSSNNNSLPFSLILSFFFVTSCPRACPDRYKLLSFKSTIRVTIPLRQFGRLVAVSPPHFVRRTVVHPITPIVHLGREVPVFYSPYKVLMYRSFRCYRRYGG